MNEERRLLNPNAARFFFGLLLAVTSARCDRTVATRPVEHVRVLAGDAMEGRGLGQPGLQRALDYAESVMRTAALDAEGAIIRGRDSYSFFLQGLPTVIMGGGGFPEYHAPGDDLDLIKGDLLDRAVELSVAIVTRLAGKLAPSE